MILDLSWQAVSDSWSNPTHVPYVGSLSLSLFIFTANTLVTSHLELINRAALVLLLLSHKLHQQLIAYK